MPSPRNPAENNHEWTLMNANQEPVDLLSVLRVNSCELVVQINHGSSLIRTLRYQASLGGPPWICNAMIPCNGMPWSGSV